VAVILSGLICFADLVYTYKAFGTFPVQRLYLVFTGQTQETDPDDIYEAEINHNFYGEITGLAFVFILNDLIKNRNSTRLMMLLLPCMFVGVLMSTSRSSLLALIIISILIVFNGLRRIEYRRKVYRIGSFALVASIVGILLFSTVGMYFKLDNKFADEVVLRLTEEPIAMIQKALGYNYDVQNLGSMDWREEASSDAFAAYSSLKFSEQMQGIGQGGFLERNLGNGLNPHNGILLILIEAGLIGLIIYSILMGRVIFEAIRAKIFSPSFAVVGFILVYGIGQNEEITSITMFLFVVTLIAETRFSRTSLQGKHTLIEQAV
jgi:oligosaccharide repeat unit polymerase